MTISLLVRYADRIAGVLSCLDRVVIHGTLPGLCFPGGMAAYLCARKIKLFDYPKFAEPYREAIRKHAERLAAEIGRPIEYVRSAKVRKEDVVAGVLAERGDDPGLVVILSAMEGCSSYRPWHDKTTHHTSLKFRTAQCVHYYFYFIDPELGLCYLRVPTWCPFRMQFYFNGHNYLASRLRAAGIDFRRADNAFVWIADFAAAQHLADELSVPAIHEHLDNYVAKFCPAVMEFDRYHWSLMQVEYATDIVFRRQSDLKPIYENLARTAIHAVKADDVRTFLGRKLKGVVQDDLGNDFSTRIEGTRIKHYMGPTTLKMYDKRGIVLRIETTTNDVSFFKNHRQVEQRDGTRVFKVAPLRKTIYSLPDLRDLMAASNRRYIEFISTLDDPTAGTTALRKLAEPMTESGRRYRGFNFFADDDDLILGAIAHGEFCISGLRNKDLKRYLPDKKSAWISRCMKRLRVHGLIKRIGRTYKHYLTDLGRRVVLTGLKLREMVVIPMLAQPASATA